MDIFRNLAEIPTYMAPDGAMIQELAGRSTGLSGVSLAVIRHPPGTASRAHHHTVVDEVYFIWGGRGHVKADGETREVGPGDRVILRPGQMHKVWNDGTEDLVLIVTCAPAYAPDEVAWDE